MQDTHSNTYLFVGGGNMASALIGGLVRQGHPVGRITVVDPHPPARDALQAQWPGLVALPELGDTLSPDVTVWAVKPQQFASAATMAARLGGTLHISVAAGITFAAMSQWFQSQRIVRAMPNTPALVGQGMTGLFAPSHLGNADRQAAQVLLANTGSTLWVDDEAQIDVVTAVSGSGPAYVFYFMEALITAGTEMGLTREQSTQLTLETFHGASELARQSTESPRELRLRVTSKGGTTHAAISSLEADDSRAIFINAVLAARERAQQMAAEFGHF